jgi:protein-tyrosine phosphatase
MNANARLIDLHCHILPGIDDGPAATEESVELARALERDGVRTAAATPHLREDHPRVRVVELADRCRLLEEELRRNAVKLLLVPGAEVDIVWGLEAQDDELRLASFAQRGKDLLIETPYGLLPSNFEEMLFGFAVKGYRLLLAHPERNASFQGDPRRLGDLVKRGVLIQVMATSLSAPLGRSRPGRLARSLVGEGLAHVLASDVHGSTVPGRVPLSAGVRVARALVGPRADWMVMDAPAAVLAGEPLPPMPSVTRSKWRGRFAVHR